MSTMVQNSSIPYSEGKKFRVLYRFKERTKEEDSGKPYQEPNTKIDKSTAYKGVFQLL